MAIKLTQLEKYNAFDNYGLSGKSMNYDYSNIGIKNIRKPVYSNLAELEAYNAFSPENEEFIAGLIENEGMTRQEAINYLVDQGYIDPEEVQNGTNRAGIAGVFEAGADLLGSATDFVKGIFGQKAPTPTTIGAQPPAPQKGISPIWFVVGGVVIIGGFFAIRAARKKK